METISMIQTNAEAKKRRAPKRQPAKNTTNAVVDPKRKVTVVGVDIGDKHLQFCEIDSNGEISDFRIPNNEKRIRENYQGKVARRFIVEMGSQTRWIAELLQSLEHEVIIVDPRKLKLISQSLYKDDRCDAMTLATLGTQAPGLLITVPLRKLEDQRILTLVRARATAVAGRTRLVNGVRGMLKPYGIRMPKFTSKDSFNLGMIDVTDNELRRAIEPLLNLIDAFSSEIELYDDEAERLLSTIPPDAARLTEIPGVGALTALFFASIVGDPARFSRARDIGPYLGLCRRRNDSGDYKSELGITKAGDPYMRALLANCANQILGPFGKDCDLRTWGLKKTGGKSRAEKKKAKVATARKLAVIMLTLWKTGKPYEPLRQAKEQLPAQA